jgi:hypothetical protein
MIKVRIKKVPGLKQARTGYQVQGALANDVPAFGGADYNAYIGKPQTKVSRTLQPVAREGANLEAEKNETVVTNDGSNMPAFYTIGGKRHYEGGTPLNLPDDSFIFSDTKAMKIKDPAILKKFGLSPKDGGYTPAAISKKYDLNPYRKILQDPDSDKLERKTAEMMLKNYTMKLGELALIQESMKGFPQEIPLISKPYMEANGISEEELLPQKAQPQQQPTEEYADYEEVEQGNQMPSEMPSGEPIAQPMQDEQMMQMGQEQMMAYGGYPMEDYFFPYNPVEMAYGGYLPKAAPGAITPYEKAKTKKGNITPTGKQNKFSDRDQKLEDYLGQWEADIPGIKDMSEGQAQKAIYEWSLKNNPDAIRSMWQEFGLTNKGMESSKLRALSQNKTGTFTEEMLKDPELLGKLQEAYVDNYFGVRQLDPLAKKEEDPKVIENPNAPVQKCYCPDENGNEVETPMVDGKCLCDEYTAESEYDPGFAPPRRRSGFYLQDTINTANAFANLMGLKKYLPITQRMQPIEYGVNYLDPTRNIAGQNEATAQLAKAVSSTAAGPANRATLAAMQGKLSKGVADVSSQYDNANVGIANQYKQGLGALRNQYNMLNNQLTKQLGNENAIANQQYDNSKMALRGNLAQAYNTATTNAAQTDALNQMTPNYQIDPESGGFVDYVATDKTVDPGTKQKDALDFAYELQGSGLSPKMQEMLFKQNFDVGRYGGQFANGGAYVMGDTVFPFMFY